MEYNKTPLVHVMVNSNQGLWVETRVNIDGEVEIMFSTSETPIVVRPGCGVFVEVSQPAQNVLMLRMLRSVVAMPFADD